jgi:hypothetical protein
VKAFLISSCAGRKEFQTSATLPLVETGGIEEGL